MSGDKENIIIYNTVDGKASVSLYARDGMVWMNQNQIAELFDTSKQNIGQHIANVLKEEELPENSVVKNFFTTAADGKQYKVTFYALDMVLAIGFRVRCKRGTQFRIWANRNLKEYMVKGFVMDDERLKNPDGRPDYFDELLERIRDIRASEKRFYQKLRDLFSLSSDYDPTDKATQRTARRPGRNWFDLCAPWVGTRLLLQEGIESCHGLHPKKTGNTYVQSKMTCSKPCAGASTRNPQPF
ncbi:RhuM family protein [Desulfonatronospira sp.]|uniref:RhuM family protein n=1 Tax=Desulfonatronospira sp. TaxID=1962951 RepID=UPI0025BA874B|nr:RhuM family protein [Desulfonatronospira sp.]